MQLKIWAVNNSKLDDRYDILYLPPLFAIAAEACRRAGEWS